MGHFFGVNISTGTHTVVRSHQEKWEFLSKTYAWPCRLRCILRTRERPIEIIINQINDNRFHFHTANRKNHSRAASCRSYPFSIDFIYLIWCNIEALHSMWFLFQFVRTYRMLAASLWHGHRYSALILLRNSSTLHTARIYIRIWRGTMDHFSITLVLWINSSNNNSDTSSIYINETKQLFECEASGNQ